jgi:hypothetical protein
MLHLACHLQFSTGCGVAAGNALTFQITGAVLMGITMEDMRDMGMLKLGDRKVLANALSHIQKNKRKVDYDEEIFSARLPPQRKDMGNQPGWNYGYYGGISSCCKHTFCPMCAQARERQSIALPSPFLSSLLFSPLPSPSRLISKTTSGSYGLFFFFIVAMVP